MLHIEDHISLLKASMASRVTSETPIVIVQRESLEAVLKFLEEPQIEYAVQTYRKDGGEPLGIRLDAWTPWKYQVEEDFDTEKFVNAGHQTYGVRIVKRTKYTGQIEVVPEGELG